MTIDLSTVVEELNETYPCRETQFSSLSSLIGHPSYPSPPAIWVIGSPAGGRSTITRAFLDATKTHFCWVDCRETFTSSLLFDRIVNALRIFKGEEQRIKMSGEVNNFVVEVHKLLDTIQGKVVLVKRIHMGN